MEIPGAEPEPDHENESDENLPSPRSDEFALLLAKAIKVWERKEEITILAVSAAKQTRILIDLQQRLHAAIRAERPIELLAAEWTEASEKKAALMTPLVSAIWPDLVYIARKKTKSDAEAKDIAQEATVKLMRSIQDFEDQGKGFRPWYYGLTMNTALNEFRQGLTMFKLGQMWQTSESTPSSNPELEAEAKARAELFETAVAKLSEDCRQRFKFLKTAGTKLSGHDEIAKTLKENLEVSKKRTHVCVEHFRSAYRELSEDQSD